MRSRTFRAVVSAVTATLATVGGLAVSGPAAAHGRPLSYGCSPSVSLTGFSDVLDKTTYRDSFVGNISAIAPDRRGSLAALSDRSELFQLDARTLKPRGVLSLADENGAPLDSEGLVVDQDGTYLVSSEVEPSIRRYSRTGKILDRLPVPEELRTAPEGGAQANSSFEGLTLLPGGRTLLASMEDPIAGDPADVVRFQTWQRTLHGDFRIGAQYTYRIDSGLGVAEVTATPDGHLIVLERGFTTGVGNTVRLYQTDAHGRKVLGKKLLADVVDCPTLGATTKQPQPNPLLDNYEAMTVTGWNKGRLELLVASDDNQNPVQTTRFLTFRVRV